MLQELNDEDPVIISVDANFGLVRKLSAGISIEPPKRKVFFIEQSIVDAKVVNTKDLSGKELVNKMINLSLKL